MGAAGTDRFDVVYVPIAEHASATQVARWRAFVEAGGSLIAATEIPGFGPQTLVEDESPGQIFDVVSSLEPGQCDLDALAGDHLGPIEAPLGLTSYDVAPDAGSCFGDGRSAAIVTEEFGLGTVTTIGSPALFANEGMTTMSPRSPTTRSWRLACSIRRAAPGSPWSPPGCRRR